MKTMPRKLSGFTLIELMIAVVIVAILAAIAIPSYESYIRKARRSNAQSFVSQIALKEDEYFAHMRSYTSTWGSGGLGLAQPSETSGHYAFSVCTAAGDAACSGLANFPANGFIVVAKRVAGSAQANDTVGDVVYYSSGRKCMTAQPDDKWGKQTC